jgi:hypothetical protein
VSKKLRKTKNNAAPKMANIYWKRTFGELSLLTQKIDEKGVKQKVPIATSAKSFECFHTCAYGGLI